MYYINDIDSMEETVNSIIMTVRESFLDNIQITLERRKKELNQLLTIIQTKEDNLEEKKRFVLIILELCLEINDILNSYINSLETIKEKLKRFKIDSDDQKFLNSVFSFDKKSYQILCQSSSEISFKLPDSLTKKMISNNHLSILKNELYICRLANNELINKMKDFRKKYNSESDKIRKLYHSIKEEDYILLNQEQYEHLINKTTIYETLNEFANDSIKEEELYNYFIDVVNDCCKKYEQHEKEKKMNQLALQNYKKSLKTLSLEPKEVPYETIEIEPSELEDITVHNLEEANVWLDMLREGVEMSLILNTLNLKKDEKVNQCFYEALKKELEFFKDYLVPLANTLEEKEIVKQEIIKYENYIYEFETFFSELEEPILEEEKNRLIFATTPSGNPCFDLSLSNIQSDFSKKELLKALKIIRYKDSDFIHSRLKPLNKHKNRKGFYQYRAYDVRILLRILDENTYYIIQAFVKKCNRTHGYSTMLTQTYESTYHQYEELKELLKNDFLKEEFFNFHDSIYEQIQSYFDSGKKKVKH